MVIILKLWKIFSAQFFVPMPENQQMFDQTAQPSTNSLSYGTVPYSISSENMVKSTLILYFNISCHTNSTKKIGEFYHAADK